jgi:hypothetical protein
VRTVTTAVALGMALALSACSSGNPTIELSQAAPGAASGSSGPTSTTSEVLTLSDTPTPTPTTVTVTVTVTATPTVTVTALPLPSPTTATTFDRAVALIDYGNLVKDIEQLDRMTLTGAQAALQLDVLANHYASLAAGGSPPGLDAPTYYARLSSLRLFAAAASREAQAGSPQAAARYAVIRTETGTFLALVNGALGTALSLPPAPATTPTP